jgi:hypothetical protein
MYKESPSQAGRIIPTAKGFSITEKQTAKLAELKAKVKLTENQAKERDELEKKAANALLPSPLSEGAKTRVQEKFLQDQFAIKKDFWSKETDKGNETEEESIRLYGKVAGIFGIKKNEKTFENDYFIGTPDIVTKDAVIDIKTAWDGSTFPWFADELPTMNYFYQVQAYLHLTGRKKGFVAYCLTNATEEMTQDEVRREAWRQKIIDPTDEQIAKIETKVYKQMTFDRIPDELRVKIYAIDYDPAVIEIMIERVLECRKYYDFLGGEISNRLK